MNGPETESESNTELLKYIAAFGSLMGFVDNKRNTEWIQSLLLEILMKERLCGENSLSCRHHNKQTYSAKPLQIIIVVCPWFMPSEYYVCFDYTAVAEELSGEWEQYMNKSIKSITFHCFEYSMQELSEEWTALHTTLSLPFTMTVTKMSPPVSCADAFCNNGKNDCHLYLSPLLIHRYLMKVSHSPRSLPTIETALWICH